MPQPPALVQSLDSAWRALPRARAHRLLAHRHLTSRYQWVALHAPQAMPRLRRGPTIPSAAAAARWPSQPKHGSGGGEALPLGGQRQAGSLPHDVLGHDSTEERMGGDVIDRDRNELADQPWGA